MFGSVLAMEVGTMNLDLIRSLRNILLRTLAVTVGLTWLMAIATICFWNTWSGITAQQFHTPPEALGPIVVGFFSAMKLFAICFLLAPALALHWSLKATPQH